MTEKSRTAGEKKANDSRGRAKKPYQKPEFRYERVFETMALACGKIHNTQASCRGNRKSS